MPKVHPDESGQSESEEYSMKFAQKGRSVSQVIQNAESQNTRAQINQMDVIRTFRQMNSLKSKGNLKSNPNANRMNYNYSSSMENIQNCVYCMDFAWAVRSYGARAKLATLCKWRSKIYKFFHPKSNGNDVQFKESKEDKVFDEVI